MFYDQAGTGAATPSAMPAQTRICRKKREKRPIVKMDRPLCSDIPEYSLSIYPDGPAVVRRNPVMGGIFRRKIV